MNDIQLVRTSFLRGPNVYALFPVMEAMVDLGPWENTPSSATFSRRLVELLPELKEHHCSEGRPGGFLRRLEMGTYPAHIIEHTCLALQTRAGAEVYFGKSRQKKGSLYTIVVEYVSEELAKMALSTAIQIVNGLLKDKLDLKEIKIAEEGMKKIYQREKLGPSTQAIIDAAKKKNIPYARLDPELSLFTLGWGVYQKRIWASITSATSLLSSDIGRDKEMAKRILSANGIPVPYGETACSENEALAIASRIMRGGKPVLLKPVSAHHGKGVMGNLVTEEEVKEAYRIASKYGPRVMVEEYVQGDDYRFLVVDGNVVAVAKRIPAHVVGDGCSTIKALVDKVNMDPLRGEGHESMLTRLRLGEEELRFLRQQGIDPEHVPDRGEIIFLRSGGNLSTGGTAENVTDMVHPSIKETVERAAKIIGLDVAGVDVIAEDITLPKDETKWAVIEINSSPGLRMHLSPTKGEPIPVGEHIVDYLFPGGNGRIPLVAITGTNGKTTTARMVNWIAMKEGFTTGLAVTGGIWIGGKKVAGGDTTGPWSARLVLNDPNVEFAVVETARGGILKRGLGFDRCLVSVVTNIGEDHIGVDGIESIDDIFWIKSVLVEATEKEGWCVINAGDRYACHLAERAKGKPIFFSTEVNDIISESIEKKTPVFLYEKKRRDTCFVAYINGKRVVLGDESELSFSVGDCRPLIEDVLAALAASYATGIPLPKLFQNLSSFKLNEENNPGRMNLYHINGFTVLLDYAHNPEAIRAVGSYCSHLKGKRKIIVFAVPGDRTDELIKRCGMAAAEWFDIIVCTENRAILRGREPGEIAHLIGKGVEEAIKTKTTKYEIISDMDEALSFAMTVAEKGDVLAFVDLDLTKKDVKRILKHRT